MNCWRSLLTAFSMALALCCDTAEGAIVLLKNRDEPVVGSVVREEKERVVVRTLGLDGKPHEEVILRSDVEEILPSVSTDRLVELEPVKPAGYRDYAEELWARRKDPEARDMAIRLNLIAAWLAPEKLGRSALLALVSLARTPQEQVRFAAALYLIDPRTPLSAIDAPAAKPAAAETTTALELLRALRLLRTGKGSTARAIAEKPAVAGLLETYNRLLTRAEFNAASG
jgi:hypothetical protein